MKNDHTKHFLDYKIGRYALGSVIGTMITGVIVFSTGIFKIEKKNGADKEVVMGSEAAFKLGKLIVVNKKDVITDADRERRDSVFKEALPDIRTTLGRYDTLYSELVDSYDDLFDAKDRASDLSRNWANDSTNTLFKEDSVRMSKAYQGLVFSLDKDGRYSVEWVREKGEPIFQFRLTYIKR